MNYTSNGSVISALLPLHRCTDFVNPFCVRRVTSRLSTSPGYHSAQRFHTSLSPTSLSFRDCARLASSRSACAVRLDSSAKRNHVVTLRPIDHGPGVAPRYHPCTSSSSKALSPASTTLHSVTRRHSYSLDCEADNSLVPLTISLSDRFPHSLQRP